MTNYLAIIVTFLFLSSAVYSQNILDGIIIKDKPCKSVKQGMTKDQVIHLVGNPDKELTLGSDNRTDSLTLWNYGNQQVVFSANKVERVIADVKAENDLLLSFHKGTITADEFKERLNNLAEEGCK